MKKLDWIDICIHCVVAFACGLLGWGAALVISIGFLWREAEQFRGKHERGEADIKRGGLYSVFYASFYPGNWSWQKRLEGYLPIPFAIAGAAL